MVRRALRRTKFAKQSNHTPRDFRRHRRSSNCGFLNRIKQTRRRGILEQIAGGPGAKRIKHLIIVVVNSERENRHCGKTFTQNLDSPDTRHPRQTNIGQYNIGKVTHYSVERRFHAVVTADTTKSARAIDQGCQTFTHLAHVFNDHNSDEIRRNRMTGCCHVLLKSWAH